MARKPVDRKLVEHYAEMMRKPLPPPIDRPAYSCRLCGEVGFDRADLWCCPRCHHHWSMDGSTVCGNCHAHRRPKKPTMKPMGCGVKQFIRSLEQ